MVASTFDKVTTFDLELPTGRAALTATPEQTLTQCSGLVVIDEVQRMPELFTLLRPLADRAQSGTRFLLLGSASPDLIRGVSESLAGRVQFLDVPGLSIAELAQQDQLWLRGGFPRATLAGSDAAAGRWLENFRATFLERDLANLLPGIPAATMGRFWSMAAHYHGQIWNASELGRSMGCSHHATNRYRDLLAGTFMLRVLQPWHENLGKRLVKSPKVYLRDSGMLHHLLGIESMLSLRGHPRYGASWEGFALEQILTCFGSRDAYFWATQAGAELDLLLLRQGQRWGFEFKCADAPTTSRSMHIAMDDLQLAHLFVVYPGKDRYELGPKITALPLRAVPDLDLVATGR